MDKGQTKTNNHLSTFKPIASSGVTLDEVGVVGKELRIKVKQEAGVKYVIEFIGVPVGEQQARVLKTTSAPHASFKLPGHIFVRAKITSTKLKQNPFQPGDYETAWTQPVRVE